MAEFFPLGSNLEKDLMNKILSMKFHNEIQDSPNENFSNIAKIIY